MLIQARRDLRGSLPRMRIFIASLIMGVAIMACIGSLSAAINAGIARDAAKLLGGDIELKQPHVPITTEQRAILESYGKISELMDLRSMATAANGQRRLVELKAVDDSYPLYGTLELSPVIDKKELQSGHVAFVEKTLLEVLSIEVGDSITLGNLSVKVAAIIEDEPDRVVSIFSLGPRVMVSTKTLNESGLIQPGSLVDYHYGIKLNDVTKAEELKQTLLAKYPNESWRVRTASEAVPGVKNTIDTLTLFLSLTGLTALITGGIGIGNAVRAYLIRKRATIAIMKCLGATSDMVLGIYMLQLMFIGALSILVGLVVGATIPFLLQGLLQDLLPVPIEMGIYPDPLKLSAFFGILTLLIFSLIPLLQQLATRPSLLFRGDSELKERTRLRWDYWFTLCFLTFAMYIVAVVFTGNEIITTWFAAGLVASLIAMGILSWLIRLFARKLQPHIKSLSTRSALAGLYRPGAATNSIILALGIGMTLLVALVSVNANLRSQIAEGLPKEAPSFFLIDIQTHEKDTLASTITTIDPQASFESLPMVRGRITHVNGVESNKAAIKNDAKWAIRSDRGLTYSAEMPAGSTLVEGKWWPKDYAGEPLISFDAKLAEGMGLTLGDSLTITILGREFTAKIANLRSINWATMRMNFAIIFSPGVLEGAPQTHLATLRLDEAKESDFVKMMGERFTGVSIVRLRDSLKQVEAMLTTTSRVILLVAGFTVFSGILVMASAILSTTERRRYDTVILKVLGASKRQIITIYALEFILLAACTAVLSLGLGTIAAWGVMQLMIFKSFTVFPVIMISTVILSVITLLIVGLYAVRGVFNTRPLALLRNE